MAVRTLLSVRLIPHPSRPGRMEKTKGKSEIAFVRSLFPSESLISPVKRSVQLLSGAAAAVLQSEFEVATPLSVMLTA